MDAVLSSPDGSALRAAVWPLMGTHFARVYLPSVSVHLDRLINVPILVTETVGAILLIWEFLRRPSGRAS